MEIDQSNKANGGQELAPISYFHFFLVKNKLLFPMLAETLRIVS